MITLPRYLLLLACFFFLSVSYSHTIQDWKPVPMPVEDSTIPIERDKLAHEIQDTERKNGRPPSLHLGEKKFYKAMINRKKTREAYKPIPQEENSEVVHVGMIRQGMHENLYVDIKGDQLINFVIDSKQPDTFTTTEVSQSVDVLVNANAAKRLRARATNTRKIKEGTHVCVVKNQVLLLTKQDADLIAHYRSRPPARVKNPYHFTPVCQADSRGLRCPKEFKIELSDKWIATFSLTPVMKREQD